MPVHTLEYKIEYKPSGSWLTIADSTLASGVKVVSVPTVQSLNGTSDNALSFGDDSSINATVELQYDAIAEPAQDTPIRITYTRDVTTVKTFTGIIQSVSATLDTMTLECTGYASLISRAKVYSTALFRRPVATKTDALTDEDPTSTDYMSGLINYVLWQAGGRPVEQDVFFPSARFYYSCDQALLVPEWSWVAGDNGWDQIKTLAQASGGQVYQDGNGVVRYRQLYNFGVNTPIHAFAPGSTIGVGGLTVDYYKDATYSRPNTEVATKFVCPFLPRRLLPLQEVYNDTPYLIVQPGITESLDLEPKLPLYSLEMATSTTLPADALTVSTFVGATATAYTYTVSVLAQRVTIAFTNTGTEPFIVNRIILRGEPIGAGEPGSSTFGTGTEERNLPNNDNVQSYRHALRLATLYGQFHGTARRVVTLSGVPFNPDRAVGEAVKLYVPQWSISNITYIITSISISDTGMFADYTLVDATDLPTTNQYFLVGPSYSGLTRKIAV